MSHVRYDIKDIGARCFADSEIGMRERMGRQAERIADVADRLTD